MIFAPGFGCALLQPAAFEFGEVIDKQLAFEVIHLMLDADGQHAFSVELKGLAMLIQRTNADACGAFYRLIDTGHRQAAFLAKFIAFPAEYFRVDEAPGLVAAFRDIQDHQPDMLVNLCSGEADTRCGIHGFEHIPDQQAVFSSDRRHWLRLDPQSGVRVLDDFQHCHVASFTVWHQVLCNLLKIMIHLPLFSRGRVSPGLLSHSVSRASAMIIPWGRSWSAGLPVGMESPMKFSQSGSIKQRGFRSSLASILLVTLASFASGLNAQQGGGVVLNPSHPDTYVVKSGDTLWDISARFLRDPWYWPEIWYVNPQVANPHLIYPGDVLTLVYVDGKPQLRLERGTAVNSGKLSPRVREEPLESAIYTLPYGVVAPFLSKGMVLEKGELEKLPYIVALRDDHLVGATGNDVYVRGKPIDLDGSYSLIHPGERLIDPDDGDVVGYEGIFVAEGKVIRAGDPATVKLNASAQEAVKGDRLLSHALTLPMHFMPRAPAKPVEGRIIHVVDGVTQIGQYQVVIINRGARHGLESGHVLSVWQAGEQITDMVKSGVFNRKVQLPDERAGLLMVFKTYDRISYGLIVSAESAIHELDKVRNPD